VCVYALLLDVLLLDVVLVCCWGLLLLLDVLLCYRMCVIVGPVVVRGVMDGWYYYWGCVLLFGMCVIVECGYNC